MLRAAGNAFASAGKLGIIAGGGQVPLQLAGACAGSGRGFYVIGILGEAAREIARYPHMWAGIGAVGAVMRALRRENCSELVFAGPVRRPDLRRLQLDWGGLRILPGYIRAAAGGDDRLLRFMVETFERAGFRVIGAHQVLAALTAPAGVPGKLAPGPEHAQDIAQATAAARAIGARDIGQAAVACNGMILAVEAAEGTDAMLARVAALPEELRGSANARRGVLAKLPKPGQERRIDLPALGVSTVRCAAAAGLAGIVFEAGGALIIDLPLVIEAADAAGIFLLGIDPMQAPMESDA